MIEIHARLLRLPLIQVARAGLDPVLRDAGRAVRPGGRALPDAMEVDGRRVVGQEVVDQELDSLALCEVEGRAGDGVVDKDDGAGADAGGVGGAAGEGDGEVDDVDILC